MKARRNVSSRRPRQGRKRTGLTLHVRRIWTTTVTGYNPNHGPKGFNRVLKVPVRSTYFLPWREKGEWTVPDIPNHEKTNQGSCCRLTSHGVSIVGRRSVSSVEPYSCSRPETGVCFYPNLGSRQ